MIVTPMQKLVLDLLVQDKSNKEIAAALDRNVHVVKHHMTTLQAKYKKTRVGLAVMWTLANLAATPHIAHDAS